MTCVLPGAFPASLTSHILVFRKGNLVSVVSCHVVVFNKSSQPPYHGCTHVIGTVILQMYFFFTYSSLQYRKEIRVSDYCHFIILDSRLMSSDVTAFCKPCCHEDPVLDSIA
jgi:hypothetical protein